MAFDFCRSRGKHDHNIRIRSRCNARVSPSRSAQGRKRLTLPIVPVYLLRKLATTVFLWSLITGVSAQVAMAPGVTPSQYFRPLPVSAMDKSTRLAIEYSVGNGSGLFHFDWWLQRGMLIREGGNNLYCLGNLSYALMNLGALSAGEYSGAAGALALLPTAGALIGAPTKELWVIFKLMPIVGVLTMCLSIGGTIMPTSIGAYTLDTLDYGGMIATEQQKSRARDKAQAEAELAYLPPHRRFARQVARRSEDITGGNGYIRIWTSVLLQAVFLGCIFAVLWFGQRGSIIPWLCRVWGWMYFWFTLVIVSSLAENFTSTPFTKTWTMRVSRAPKNIELSEYAPRISLEEDDPEQAFLNQDNAGNRRSWTGTNVLQTLKNGVDSQSKIVVFDGDPCERPNSCFFVVVSLQGATTTPHAALKFASKAFSLVVYTFGTTLFAATQLMSGLAALMVISVTLGCATFARINALSIAAEMNKSNDPILHAIVQTEKEANEYVGSVLAERGLLVELMGHIVVEGRVVARFSPWLSLASYIGLLAPPFDLQRIAVSPQSVLSRRQTWESMRSNSDFGTPRRKPVPIVSSTPLDTGRQFIPVPLDAPDDPDRNPP